MDRGLSWDWGYEGSPCSYVTSECESGRQVKDNDSPPIMGPSPVECTVPGPTGAQGTGLEVGLTAKSLPQESDI